MYKIKQIPADFVVKEISNLQFENSGRYAFFRLTKKNRNTFDVVKQLAKIFSLKEKNIGFAGSKDKHAVTEQTISILNVNKDKVLSAKIDNVHLDFLGYNNKPLSLGELEGNHFEIVVRNLDPEKMMNVKLEKISFIENYFDEQRFSKSNVKIGRNLINKKFQEAVRLIDDQKIKEYLQEKNNDYIGALKKIPLRLLRMYTNAYQSYLWNMTVAEYLKVEGAVFKMINYSQGKLVFVDKQIKDLQIPLIGFASKKLEKETKVKKIMEKIINKEKIGYKDFIIKQIPELSLEGESRTVFVEIKDLEIGKAQKDELNKNKNKKKVRISFSLPKGSYATMVVRKIFKV